MTISNLDKIFHPSSIVLIGASDEINTVGKTVTNNLLQAGFLGKFWFVNPNHSIIAGQKCWSNVKDLPIIPDLAIIATPPKTIPLLIDELAQKGIKAAVIISAGIDTNMQKSILAIAKPYCFRIIGPNCFGLMVPPLGLNASFSHLNPLNGELAFISQSGAIIGAMIGWSINRKIGFSHIVSLGNMMDIDVGDILDYLVMDPQTKVIILYLEHITHPRKFMSAARAAAQIKPIVVIKSGRHTEGARAAASHTGALSGADIVYDSVFRRVGIIRVTDLEELFDAAEILSRSRPLSCEHLTILTNGGGAGVLAVDRLIDYGGKLACLGSKTIQKLNTYLPSNWSRTNPIDIIGDANP
ncbi:MAG: CoA-binding protein, partial [Alphaproteobacteria bacterium]|nr:CoA-binding protein [Alphaproteobacteria bacterium]